MPKPHRKQYTQKQEQFSHNLLNKGKPGQTMTNTYLVSNSGALLLIRIISGVYSTNNNKKNPSLKILNWPSNKTCKMQIMNNK